jgi:peptide/nickel transport system permease protein
MSVVALGWIVLVAIVALTGPFIRPDQTPNANDQELSISRQKPGYSTMVFAVCASSKNSDISVWEMWRKGGREKACREYPADSLAFSGNSLQLFKRGEIVTELGPEEHGLESGSDLAEISEDRWYRKQFLLGTDRFGRDVLSRLMAGSAISLGVGCIAVVISLLLGTILGAFAGYYGGRTDAVIMWFINVIWSVPTLLLVIAITFAFGKGMWKVFLAVGLTMWVEVARVVRGQFMSVSRMEFVEAARALGYSDVRIMFRHILPNIMGPVVVIAAANFASAILVEAGLSFLGIGAQIPVPSWGNMIKEHYALITTDLAYLAFLPGVCIMMLVLSFMLVGDGLKSD